MTTAAQPMLGASPPEELWNAIDWRTTERQVLRLQMRIAKATRSRSRRRVLYPRAFVRLEPYVGKLASTVLRGG